jgi:hypothetical protein
LIIVTLAATATAADGTIFKIGLGINILELH